MRSNKYTLDRFEGEHAVFLKHPNETESLLVARSEINEPLEEGDIVSITVLENSYKIEKHEKETMDQRDKVQRLLEQLKNGK
ncbi:DUF3006 domain-containing protein [Psychrobacillus sp. FJAT-51614]|uniref:DUF3006 domain-containing protein n=1 Tax=Psychrobacillus mangrovi TaxID=3117745 RepID=A0ABU8F5F0_9BACI